MNINDVDLYSLIRAVCSDLNIKKPRIVKTDKGFATETTIARYDCSIDTLFLNENTALSNLEDEYFAVCHELRHKWQLKHDWKFDDYISSNNTDIESYNKQPIEIDANAYAACVMKGSFNLIPLFNGFSQELKDMIINRAIEITQQNIK